MKKHILSKHKPDSERKNKCEFCGKGFLTIQHLKDHTNIHTGERPYMCSFCGSTFASKGNWLNHVKTVHLGHKRDKNKTERNKLLGKPMELGNLGELGLIRGPGRPREPLKQQKF